MTKLQTGFVARFALLLLCLHGIYYAVMDKMAPIIINLLNVAVSVRLINFVTPGEAVVQKGDAICSGSRCMTVAQGCDGMDGVLIVLAAVLAFPMAWRLKLWGTGLGFLVVYLFNLIRVSMLYYIVMYRPAWFTFMHVYVGQGLVVFSGAAFFLFWVNLHGVSRYAGPHGQTN